MHVVAVVVTPGVVPFDLAIPCEVFGRARALNGSPLYDVRVCGSSRFVRTPHYDLRVPNRLSTLHEAATVIVPGIEDIAAPVPQSVAAALRAAADRGARIASICSGAFVLAQAGLLDGLRVTTHWLAAPALAARHPRIEVDAGVLFVDQGHVLTSAGAAAGLDLCLHMLRQDHGAAVAADAARMAVMPLQRQGGQAQFVSQPPPGTRDSLAALLGWLEANLQHPLGLDDMARRAGMSGRSFNRHFHRQTGTTPLQWLLAARVRHAQLLLETTPLAIEEVASRSGFGSAPTFRDRFSRVLGVSPSYYRKTFGSGEVAASGEGAQVSGRKAVAGR